MLHYRKGLSLIAMLLIFLAFVALLIGYLLLRARIIPDEETTIDQMSEQVEPPISPVETLVSGNDSGHVTYQGQVIAGNQSHLIDFNLTDYQTAFNSNGLVVLYFYANWCPICREETANALYPAFNELTNPNVIGFRINYRDDQTDKTEEDLAREYGIAYQHTKVFIKNKQRVLKSPEQWDKQRYLSEISKVTQ